jgi:hypothetical protein
MMRPADTVHLPFQKVLRYLPTLSVNLACPPTTGDGRMDVWSLGGESDAERMNSRTSYKAIL